MPKLRKAKIREKKRKKKIYGHTQESKSYLHILNRKNKENKKGKEEQ